MVVYKCEVPACLLYFIRAFVFLSEVHLNKYVRTLPSSFRNHRLPIMVLYALTPVNISTSDQRCFNDVDQRWNNVDPTLKMKKIRRPIFNVAQRWYNVSDRRWNNVETTLHNVETTLHNVGTTLIQRYFNLASTLIKTILNPIGLVMIMDLQINE